MGCCELNINSILVNKSKFPKLLSKYKWSILLSGKGVNEFGLYTKCQNTQNHTYYMVSLWVSKLAGGPGIGLCLPSTCSSEYIRQLLQPQVDKLKSKAKQLMSNMTLIDNIRLDVYQPDIDKVVVYTSGIKVTILVCILYILLSICVSWCQLINQKKKQKIQENQQSLLSQGIQDNLVNEQQQEYMQDRINYVGEQRNVSCNEILSCFSLWQNINIFIRNDDVTNYLDLFGGIQTYGTFIGFLAHTYIFRALTLSNPVDILELVKSDYMFIIYGGRYFVEFILYIDGFNFACKHFSYTRNRRVKWYYVPLTTFTRLISGWASYIITIILVWQVLPFIVNGPFKNRLSSWTNNCNTTFWRNLLLIDNFYLQDDYCAPWGWIVSVGLQVTASSFFIVILYQYNKKFVKLLISILILIGTAWGLVMGFKNNFKAGILTDMNIYTYLNQYFFMTYMRIPSFFIGVLMGYYYSENKIQEEIAIQCNPLNKLFSGAKRYYCYGLGLLIILIMILLPLSILKDNSVWPDYIHNIYITFGNQLVTVGVAMLTIPSMLYYKDSFRLFMGNYISKLISKMSMTLYCCFFVVMTFRIFSTSTSFHYSHWNLFTDCVTTTTLTLALTTVIYILLQIPLLQIELLSLKINPKQCLLSNKDTVQSTNFTHSIEKRIVIRKAK